MEHMIEVGEKDIKTVIINILHILKKHCKEIYKRYNPYKLPNMENTKNYTG